MQVRESPPGFRGFLGRLVGRAGNGLEAFARAMDDSAALVADAVGENGRRRAGPAMRGLVRQAALPGTAQLELEVVWIGRELDGHVEGDVAGHHEVGERLVERLRAVLVAALHECVIEIFG